MLFLLCAERKGTAYFEFQYCKKDWSVRKLLRRGYKFWESDSLLVYIDDEEKFFSDYQKYLKPPDGKSEVDPFGINYYSKKHANNILKRIQEEKPTDWEILAKWLEKAASEYNGFFFLGI